MLRWSLAIVVLAVLVRELIIRLGYSWVVGTAIGIGVILGYFVWLGLRRAKR